MYDPTRSYEDNYRHGPFIDWCFVRSTDAVGHSGQQVTAFPEIRFLGEPRFSFLGHPVHLPLGVPAGPLLSSRHVLAAWRSGLSVCTYKTVRSRLWSSHPHPNVLGITPAPGVLNLRSGSSMPEVFGRPLLKADVSAPEDREGLSISNSFGVPSWSVDEWQRDVAAATEAQVTLQQRHPGLGRRVLVLSFQGSRPETTASAVMPNMASKGFDALLEDTLRTQSLAAALASILELNLSCPNEGGAPLYTDVASSLRLLEALKKERPSGVRLVVKMGSLPLDELCSFVTGSKGLVDGISAINTVASTIRGSDGGVVLGSGDRVGGVCGRLILEENLTMMARLVEARGRAGMGSEELALISVGGVHDVASFKAARAVGADHVQAATACMWSLDLAADVATELGVSFERLLQS
jgi:dihydroorotate dehydrogenase (NAD+) catalytic subunit